MNLALPLNLPKEAEEQFLPLAESEKQSVITELLIEWADKQARKKRREERLNNLSPITKKYAGFLKKSNGTNYTDEELDQVKYGYLKEKHGYIQ